MRITVERVEMLDYGELDPRTRGLGGTRWADIHFKADSPEGGGMVIRWTQRTEIELGSAEKFPPCCDPEDSESGKSPKTTNLPEMQDAAVRLQVAIHLWDWDRVITNAAYLTLMVEEIRDRETGNPPKTTK